MRRAALVNVDLDFRIQTNQGTGDARVIEMDVRQDDLPDIFERDALRAELAGQRS